jgi:general stress protein 26
MKSEIRVYLFPDTANFISYIDKNLLAEIEKSNDVKVEYYKKNYDSFFEIVGEFEQCHKTRILLQDIEKNIYKYCYENKN